jgi:hypothetical protein
MTPKRPNKPKSPFNALPAVAAAEVPIAPADDPDRDMDGVDACESCRSPPSPPRPAVPPSSPGAAVCWLLSRSDPYKALPAAEEVLDMDTTLALPPKRDGEFSADALADALEDAGAPEDKAGKSSVVILKLLPLEPAVIASLYKFEDLDTAEPTCSIC